MRTALALDDAPDWINCGSLLAILSRSRALTDVSVR